MNSFGFISRNDKPRLRGASARPGAKASSSNVAAAPAVAPPDFNQWPGQVPMETQELFSAPPPLRNNPVQPDAVAELRHRLDFMRVFYGRVGASAAVLYAAHPTQGQPLPVAAAQAPAGRWLRLSDPKVLAAGRTWLPVHAVDASTGDVQLLWVPAAGPDGEPTFAVYDAYPREQ